MTSISSSTVPTVSSSSTSPQTAQSSSDGRAATAVTISSGDQDQILTVSSSEQNMAYAAEAVHEEDERSPTIQEISSEGERESHAGDESEDLELLEARSQAAEARLRLLEAQRRSATGSRASRTSSARASKASSASISSANLASARAERPPQPSASRQHAVPAPRLIDRPAAHPRTAVHTVMDEELDRKSTRLNSSHSQQSRMPSSA